MRILFTYNKTLFIKKGIEILRARGYSASMNLQTDQRIYMENSDYRIYTQKTKIEETENNLLTTQQKLSNFMNKISCQGIE